MAKVQRVKIFSGLPDEVEGEVNRWLARGEKTLDEKLLRLDEGSNDIILVIFYKYEKKK